MTTDNPTPQPAGDDRDSLVKTFAYEFVRFNHDTRQVYLVTDVTDDCMLELEGMSGLFAPSLFQVVKNVPEPTPVADGRYCRHHDDDPAHTKECYVADDAAQPVGEGGAPSNAAWRAWFDALESRATVGVVNATAALVIAERGTAYSDGYYDGLRQGQQLARATQPATAPGDLTKLYDEFASRAQLVAYDKKQGINLYAVYMDTVDEIFLRVLAETRGATSTDVAERARRAAREIAVHIKGTNSDYYSTRQGLDDLADIIAAEFRGETK